MWGCLAARAEKTSPRLLRDLLMEQASFWCLPSTCDLASLSLHPQASLYHIDTTFTILVAHMSVAVTVNLFLLKSIWQVARIWSVPDPFQDMRHAFGREVWA